MLDRMTAGTVPDKPHTALRDAAGQLRHEECLTRDGFEGAFTILYHEQRPHTAHDVHYAVFPQWYYPQRPGNRRIRSLNGRRPHALRACGRRGCRRAATG